MKRLVAASYVALAGTVHAAGITGNSIEEITVFGSGNVLVGDPLSATEGYIFGDQLTLRPLSRPAELLEFVPGLIATQHSGEGKGNQYFLRGFNLDHGTDLALKVDGVPVNMPSHAHGQGYADINFLIPELVEHLEYRKGPYYAEIGDFGTAASSEFVYVDSLEQGNLTVTAGQDDYRRVYAGDSVDLFRGKLTLAAAITNYAGPWQLDQDLDKLNGLLKYYKNTNDGHWSLSASGYTNDWNSTDPIPQRAMNDGSLSRFGTIDKSDGGQTHRHSLAGDWQKLGEDSALNVSAYVSIDLPLNNRLRAVAALRADHFSFDVAADLAVNSGKGSDDLLSPKLSLIYSQSEKTEFFFRAGQGFHSNDARGTTISVDPVTCDPADTVDPLSKARSIELGMRNAAMANTQFAMSLFSMKLDSELTGC